MSEPLTNSGFDECKRLRGAEIDDLVVELEAIRASLDDAGSDEELRQVADELQSQTGTVEAIRSRIVRSVYRGEVVRDE